MTSRERWIVFPLLFLTLGIALRDKLVPPAVVRLGEVRAETIRCEQLEVGQASCQVLSANQVRGRLAIVDEQGHVAAYIGAFDPTQAHAVAAGQRASVLLIGNDGHRYGVFIQQPDRAAPQPLTLFYKSPPENRGGGSPPDRPKTAVPAKSGDSAAPEGKPATP